MSRSVERAGETENPEAPRQLPARPAHGASRRPFIGTGAVSSLGLGLRSSLNGHSVGFVKAKRTREGRGPLGRSKDSGGMRSPSTSSKHSREEAERHGQAARAQAEAAE